jgi:hypothetical protein
VSGKSKIVFPNGEKNQLFLEVILDVSINKNWNFVTTWNRVKHEKEKKNIIL